MHSKKGNNPISIISKDSSTKNLLVTTGTFCFDELIFTILQPNILNALKDNFCIQKLILQCGSATKFKNKSFLHSSGMLIVQVKCLKNLKETFHSCDFVISHGGAGTVTELLTEDVPFIVVPNTELVDDHQFEFCRKISVEFGVKCFELNDLKAFILENSFHDTFLKHKRPNPLNIENKIDQLLQLLEE